jgi:uncharacterized protein (TIGR00269 family)
MKCRLCGAKAVIQMRQHKLALCKEHFLDWLPVQVERAIQKYRMVSYQERILVAVSGGKDSLSLWDLLHRLGYQADGLHIYTGIDGGRAYASESLQRVERFAAARDLKLHLVNIAEETGYTIPELAARTQRGRGKPCSVCGMIKRHVMNRVARREGYDVLATGHNLDDEVAVLFGNTLSWSVEYLLRQGPVLPAEGGLVRKVKPLCRIYERETAAYAFLRGIDYLREDCPFSSGATSIFYKQLWSQLEHERPGAKLSFYLSFLEARRAGLFAAPETIRAALHPCPSCGQPTSAPDLCAYCRLLERVKAPGAPR